LTTHAWNRRLPDGGIVASTERAVAWKTKVGALWDETENTCQVRLGSPLVNPEI